jgi:uncharacterized membrane protein YhaH (DUF805 family)
VNGHKLMSTDGRFSRRAYVLFFVVPGAILLALTIAAFTVAPQILSSQISPAIALGWLVYLSTMDAQNIRRYHDLGNSGAVYRLLRPFLVILPLVAFAFQFLIPAQMASAGDMGALAFLMQQEVAFHMSPLPLAVMGLWGFGLVANILYLSAMPGQRGPNAYGPDPDNGGGLGGMSSIGDATAPAPSLGGDPVERALAEYRQSQAKPAARPVPASPAKAASTFGKKR